MGADFDTIGPVATEIKICTNTTVKVKITVSLHNNYYGWLGKQNVITKNKIKEDEMNGLTILFVNNTKSVVEFKISEFLSYLID